MNIDYAARLLKEHYARHGSWQKAIGYYHSSTAHKATNYHARVAKLSSKMVSYKQSLEKYSRSLSTKRMVVSNNKLTNEKYLGMTKTDINGDNTTSRGTFLKIQ
jgi:hypothetical protein